MSKHYLDPEREPRKCDVCDGARVFQHDQDLTWHDCTECNGTGRLGVEGAEPDLLVWDATPDGGRGWYYDEIGGDDPHGPFSTEARALAAARKAARS